MGWREYTEDISKNSVAASGNWQPEASFIITPTLPKISNIFHAFFQLLLETSAHKRPTPCDRTRGSRRQIPALFIRFKHMWSVATLTHGESKTPSLELTLWSERRDQNSQTFITRAFLSPGPFPPSLAPDTRASLTPCTTRPSRRPRQACPVRCPRTRGRSCDTARTSRRKGSCRRRATSSRIPRCFLHTNCPATL